MALENDDAWRALDEEDTDLNALVETGVLDPNSQYVRDKRADLQRRYRELAACGEKASTDSVQNR